MIIRRMHRKMINSFFHNKQHHSLMTVWADCFIFVGMSSAIIFLKLTGEKNTYKNSSSTITKLLQLGRPPCEVSKYFSPL